MTFKLDLYRVVWNCLSGHMNGIVHAKSIRLSLGEQQIDMIGKVSPDFCM